MAKSDEIKKQIEGLQNDYEKQKEIEKRRDRYYLINNAIEELRKKGIDTSGLTHNMAYVKAFFDMIPDDQRKYFVNMITSITDESYNNGYNKAYWGPDGPDMTK